MYNSSATFAEMVSIIARSTKDDRETSTAIDGLFFSRRSSPSQAIHTAQWPCLALVVQGAKSIALGPQMFNYSVGSFLVVSLNLPVMSRVTQASAGSPLLGMGMEIRQESLNEVIGKLDTKTLAVASEESLGVSVDQATAPLVDAVLRYMRLLDDPQAIPVMAPLIEQEILYRLLTGPSGGRLVAIAQTNSPSNKIAKAITWLRDNFRTSLRIEDLAGLVGMSDSSLHHHFKAITAMTPVQYQKQLRLNEARRLMLVERLDVGTASYNVGYQSPSQFSREYSRLYGRSPMRDVDMLRSDT